MRFQGLNHRQCRALLALLDGGALTETQLSRAIGGYSTNTIKALEHAQLIVGAEADEGESIDYELTQPGHAIAEGIRQLSRGHVDVQIEMRA